MTFRKLTLSQRRELREIERTPPPHREWTIGFSRERGGRLMFRIKGNYVSLIVGRFYSGFWGFNHSDGHTKIDAPYLHFWRLWRPIRGRAWRARGLLGWERYLG